MLLDEATASFDSQNERAAPKTLGALTADRTLLVITHRLDAVAAVLDEGPNANRAPVYPRKPAPIVDNQ
jgi:ABC-type multidrug transport system fused ATPase/permease subunit